MIPHNKPCIGVREADTAARVIASGMLWGGNEVTSFENEVCDFLGLPGGHAVAMASGSAALFVALKILGLAGKSVAFPSYVCSSLRHACDVSQSEPLYLDVLSDQPVPDYGSELDVAAIIHPYLYGFASSLPAQAEQIPVIEDLAQALGASADGYMLGTKGQLGILSFYATKMMTSAGQGGMLVSHDRAVADAARDFIDYDNRQDNRSHFNLGLSEVQAAVGRVQLQQLPYFIQRRDEIWRAYADVGLPLIDVPGAQYRHVRYRAVCLVENVDNVIRELGVYGVRAINPFEQGELLGTTPNALKLTQHTVSLPLYPALTDAQVRQVCEAAQEVIL